jgi:hypothetical protein
MRPRLIHHARKASRSVPRASASWSSAVTSGYRTPERSGVFPRYCYSICSLSAPEVSSTLLLTSLLSFRSCSSVPLPQRRLDSMFPRRDIAASASRYLLYLPRYCGRLTHPDAMHNAEHTSSHSTRYGSEHAVCTEARVGLFHPESVCSLSVPEVCVLCKLQIPS